MIKVALSILSFSFTDKLPYIVSQQSEIISLPEIEWTNQDNIKAVIDDLASQYIDLDTNWLVWHIIDIVKTHEYICDIDICIECAIVIPITTNLKKGSFINASSYLPAQKILSHFS